MIKHDSLIVPEKVVKVIIKLMQGWRAMSVTNAGMEGNECNKCRNCIVLYCMYFLLIWRKPSSTNRSLIKAK